jgi:hypothetical protein
LNAPIEIQHPKLSRVHIEENLVQKWKINLATEAIMFMTKFNVTERVKTEDILNHPLFWKADTEFNFFQSCFEFMNHSPENRKMVRTTNIETNANKILHNNWIDVVRNDVEFNLDGYRSYEITGLLKCMENHVSFHLLKLFEIHIRIFSHP